MSAGAERSTATSQGYPATGVYTTAGKLRQLALQAEDGALLGGEPSLITALGTSRATLRQAARLLEREGVLVVRRGPKGGYFAARPGVSSIHYAISAWLEAFDVDTDALSIVDAALWNEAARKMAAARPEDTKAIAERFQKRLDELPDCVSFQDIIIFEREWRLAVLDTINSAYLRFLFDVNVECFRTKPFWYSLNVTDTREHSALVRSWRSGKRMEFAGITSRDWPLVMMAVRYLREFWCRLAPRASVVSFLSEPGQHVALHQ